MWVRSVLGHGIRDCSGEVFDPGQSDLFEDVSKTDTRRLSVSPEQGSVIEVN